MIIKVKKLHEDAVLPKSAHDEDAGYDLIAIDNGTWSKTYIEYKTGIAIQPEPGWHTEIFPRSSISKYDLVLANSIGLVDQIYTNEVIVRFKFIYNHDSIQDEIEYPDTVNRLPVIYKKGDKIAQLVIRKTEKADFKWVDELENTDRVGGFGSTDAKK